MKKLLTAFFSLNEFWQKFELIKEGTLGPGYHATYCYKTPGRKLVLDFYELQGVKSVSLKESGRIILRSIFFINIAELTLILNRVGGIRVINPLCDGSGSIKALSCSQKS